MKIPTVSGSFSCRARAPLSASWHREPWRDPSSASGRQRSQNGKDSEACLLPQKHHYHLQRRGKTKPKTSAHHQQSHETNQNPAPGRHRHNSFPLPRGHLKLRLPQKLKMKSEEMTLMFSKIVRDERIKRGMLYLEKKLHTLSKLMLSCYIITFPFI